MFSVLGFIFLFFGLCVFVVMVLATINIFTKSYNPKHAILILSTLITLFIVNSFLVAINYSRVVANLKDFSLTPQNTNNNSSSESGDGKF